MPKLSFEGIDYAYTDEGSGPVVVFGHGLTASKEMFAPQIAALTDRYRCLSIDWPGHGDSGWPETWDLYTLARLSVALLDHVGADRAVFVGFSQGSAVFTRVALEFPERVRGLVLMSNTPHEAQPGEREIIPAMLGELRDLTPDERQAWAAGPYAELFYSELFRTTEPERVAREASRVLTHRPEGLCRAADMLIERDDIADRLGEIRAPTVVVVGEDDMATPPEVAREVAAAIDGAELVVIPQAGHHPAVEKPAETNAAIERLLRRVGP